MLGTVAALANRDSGKLPRTAWQINEHEYCISGALMPDSHSAISQIVLKDLHCED